MPPEEGSFPVFETYDLDSQYDVMAGVAEHSDVPVPRLCWRESDESVLGTPFFVMERIAGRIPEDNPPYVFVGWVFDATAEERMRITSGTVDVIAAVHAIADPAAKFPSLSGPGSSLRRHFDAQREWYRLGPGRRRLSEFRCWSAASTGSSSTGPPIPGPTYCTGVMPGPATSSIEEFEPAAVLDWEMATLGPRELDVAWFVFLHRFFQDIAPVLRLGPAGLSCAARCEQCYQN